MSQGTIAGHHHVDWLFRRIPENILGTLTEEQKTAIDHAVRGSGPRRHSVNIRISLPLMGRRYYLMVLAGKEKRSHERRKVDRQHHPMHTLGNILFGLGVLAAFYMATVFGLFFYHSLIEF